ncbi:MAG TPA: RpiB/LacA/LacB family sugar-phosphate isomerase, partial [Rhabdochlamydiaceae bacterium]
SSDEYAPILDLLIEEVKQRGHEVRYHGPAQGENSQDWTTVTLKAAEDVQKGEAAEGIILCWTGTGCTIIANKVPAIRAALCADSETAKGARIWNHANVLALSLRTTSPAILKEIITAWFETPYSTDSWNLLQIQRVQEAETAASPR